MSLGKRRPRSNRAKLQPSNATHIQKERQARQRARWARLGVVALGILAAATIVHGSGPPFTFRLGQRPSREIRVRVPHIIRRNPVKTNSERQAKADQVFPIMDNDPAPIRDLAKRLQDLVEAINRAPDRGSLAENLRTDWDIDQATFDDLKAATDTVAERDDLRRRITQAFDPLLRHGILGPDALPPREETSLSFQIRDPEHEGRTEEISKDLVLPERVAAVDGPVAQGFVANFTPSSLGLRLFKLVADKLAGLPTLTYDEPATNSARKAARDSVPEWYDTYDQGELLVDQDTEVSEEQLALLRLEHDTSVMRMTWPERLQRVLSVLVLVAALFGLVSYYVYRHEKEIYRSLPRVATLCGLTVGALGIARLLAMQPWDAELIPVALTGMILAIAYNPHFALMVSFALTLMLSLALGTGLSHFLIIMGGTAAGVLPLSDVRTRTKPIKVGAAAALGYFVLTWATGLWQSQPIGLVVRDSLWRAGWGLIAGFFLGGLLPLVETTFGIVTGISLLELGDITHPLLQELVRRAPGTHNHSVTVGTIAEAAAERIGANALLVRIGAYFHDIGKMLKPHYFIENQAGAANRHANLAPAMSTLIIIGHVKDGIDLAHQHHLPEPIVDLIQQHHGTTLVEYFYHEANRRNDGNPDAATVQESAFRYPGPKPQTREAGVLMVADAVESASRTLSEPTPARIEGLVEGLIEKRLRDGQFDECGLTLREIAEIRESLIKSLIGIYHGRVKYPEQRSA